MRALFEKLIHEGEPALQWFIDTKQQEGIELEFKNKADPTNGSPNRDDRTTLSALLSALSNSMGGLIVWGVDARKNEESIDCAVGLRPIAEIEKFKSEIQRHLSQAIMPRHEGIFLELIPSAANPQSGYLVILVERSERRPHQSSMDKLYYKRYGGDSQRMEHYEIEDSFRRLTTPSLELIIWPRIQGKRTVERQTFVELDIELSLKNLSPVSARHPYLILDELNGLGDAPKNWYLKRLGDLGTLWFQGGADDLIHPSQTLLIAIASRLIRLSDSDSSQIDNSCIPRPIFFRYKYGCYNSKQVESECFISSKQLIRLVAPGSFSGLLRNYVFSEELPRQQI